ncbi:hypothetical protein DNU06_13025 [Putridiphycobacter roseus]|uniref:Mucoidy inhibitor MuiA family protein n=1 Tax=Putridiphycobacter roseus TaxID=2219161 RepID=A0A2W1NB09_9FLAO|nr:DUF4139 domain-containing protein [Putridiphycobacter roseus]PZE16465.1 hypothetical protein DNU06_13025 [Putridiphycobacter roseus]
MKSVLLFTIFFWNAHLFAQKDFEQSIATKIKEVTVFITGGEVKRTTPVSVKKGRNILTYTGISTVVDQKSIQFIADKSVTMVSVSTAIDYLKFTDDNPIFKAINDSLRMYHESKQNFQDEVNAYQSELQLIKTNMNIKGNQATLLASELKAMADYHLKRTMELNKIISSYKGKQKKVQTRIHALSSQLQELNYKEQTHSNQIVVIVDSKSDRTINTELKYVISNCGWQANYDLSAQDVSGIINLKYKAKVFNNTGNDWEEVKLTLSSSNPNLSASAPILDAWFLNNRTVSSAFAKRKAVIVPQNRGYDQWYSNASVPQMSQNLSGVGGKLGADKVGDAVKITSIEVPQLSSEFPIKIPYSIPSNSKPYLVAIDAFDLPATFSHKAVPKLDKDAFLMANIVGWEKLNLIPGPSNVYYQGVYVGESYLNTCNVDDTLSLSFGRDNKVVVEKKLMEEFSNTKMIGANKKDTYTYEIIVKNNMGTTLNMDLFDQIPISQESDITVSVNEISSAFQNEDTGILSWKLALQPGQQQVYKVSFTIKYPKNRNITVKKYRTISAPSF